MFKPNENDTRASVEYTVYISCEGEMEDRLKRQTPGSSGYDMVYLVKETSLEPGEIKVFMSGLRMQLPKNMEAQVRSRSGLSKQGIVVMNSPGTIDSDFRGEIGIVLANLSGEWHTIKNKDRIAQIVFQRTYNTLLVQKENLDETQRNEGGFGSTG